MSKQLSKLKSNLKKIEKSINTCRANGFCCKKLLDAKAHYVGRIRILSKK